MADIWTFEKIHDGRHGSKMAATVPKWLPVIDVGAISLQYTLKKSRHPRECDPYVYIMALIVTV